MCASFNMTIKGNKERKSVVSYFDHGLDLLWALGSWADLD